MNSLSCNVLTLLLTWHVNELLLQTYYRNFLILLRNHHVITFKRWFDIDIVGHHSWPFLLVGVFCPLLGFSQ